MTDSVADAAAATSDAAMAAALDAAAAEFSGTPLARAYRITMAGSDACRIPHERGLDALHVYVEDGTRMSAAMQQFLCGGFDGEGAPAVALWEIIAQFSHDAAGCFTETSTPVQNATGVLFGEVARDAVALADEAVARGHLARA